MLLRVRAWMVSIHGRDDSYHIRWFALAHFPAIHGRLVQRYFCRSRIACGIDTSSAKDTGHLAWRRLVGAPHCRRINSSDDFSRAAWTSRRTRGPGNQSEDNIHVTVGGGYLLFFRHLSHREFPREERACQWQKLTNVHAIAKSIRRSGKRLWKKGRMLFPQPGENVGAELFREGD